jgi:DNA-binding transcriptional regulator YiaG
MTKRKTTEFNGLGFPIVLVNASLAMTPYGETLDVDFNRLQDLVFEALIRKPARFAGAEVKFIRLFMEMTQNVFADFLGVERSAVAKWEGKDLKATGMTPATEGLVRIQMARHIKRSLDKEFPYIEPAMRKTAVGNPLELAL